MLRQIDKSEETDVNKTNESKDCDICHCWYFFKKWFKFQSDVCDKCHVFSMIFMNLSDIAYLNIKGVHTAALLAILAKVRP